MTDDGHLMHSWAADLWPYPRSLTGQGVRQTLWYLSGLIPDLRIHEVPSGSRVQDWTVPDEWSVSAAYLIDPHGRRLADWGDNNLHLVGYSTPIDKVMPLEELQAHLYSSPAAPHAIPYVTSYYQPRWGFCLAQEERDALVPGDYRVVIDSHLFPGSMTYADVIIPGQCTREILLSTYVCHPSMGNNELSGIVVQAALARWIQEQGTPWYTYRFVFAPETIGSLAYLQQHGEYLRDHVRAGWVISCVGDDRTYSVIPARRRGHLGERTLQRALANLGLEATLYSWLDRGSDERQWCAPGVDLPVCGFSRSKYGMYPEYHSSLDDLTVITPEGLEGSLRVLQECVHLLEDRPRFRATTLGEPQMGRRGLYPSLSHQSGGAARRDAAALAARDLMDVLSYCDGELAADEIGDLVGDDAAQVEAALRTLAEAGVVERA